MQRFFDAYYPEVPKTWFRVGELSATYLPETPGIYFFLDWHRRVRYVGETQNIRARAGCHFTSADRRGWFAWIDVPTDMLQFTECWFIATLRPYESDYRKSRRSVDGAARLAIRREPVWKVGRKAQFRDIVAVIEDVFEKDVILDGLKLPKNKVRCILW